MDEVINRGICTHCGTCVGLSEGLLTFKRTSRGPIPTLVHPNSADIVEAAYSACPGKGLDYPRLNESVFGTHPKSWLTGVVQGFYISYSLDQNVRRAGASGGVITQILIYLLDQGLIDGAVVLKHGDPKPWLASPIIATTPEEIIAAAQSVYSPTPVNTILAEMERFQGNLAYVGLPDQVASLRVLQEFGHPGAKKVRYVIGPYTGTSTYLAAIESYLRSNGVSGLDQIEKLRYREGEWPGHLYIRTREGLEFRLDKFYYNYLIPFFITQTSLLAVDFTNELTDLSVGDAWSPEFEAKGDGYSVVITRSDLGDQLLREMASRDQIHLETLEPEDALSMHGHMFDFKKRGAFIRSTWRRAIGLPSPSYGYEPASIAISRYLVEAVISLVFAICRTEFSRKIIEKVPIKLIGPAFNLMRKSWKMISKPSKRKGLLQMKFTIDEV